MLRSTAYLLPHVPFWFLVTAALLGAALFGGGLLVGGGLLASPALAQEGATQSKKHESFRYEDVGWYKVTLIKFEPGKSRKALSMIDRFWNRAAGGTDALGQARAPVPTVVEMPRGPWDVMMIYSLEKRPVEIRWKTPAELGELQKAFREDLDEEAQKTWQECKRLIARSTSFVGFSGLRGRGLTSRE